MRSSSAPGSGLPLANSSDGHSDSSDGAEPDTADSERARLGGPRCCTPSEGMLAADRRAESPVGTG
eukprot:1413255-Prymnesium_polylepis.1